MTDPYKGTKYEGATPGPWIDAGMGCIKGGPVQKFARGDGQQQIAMACVQSWMETAELNANATLIADAPAILAAARELREALRDALRSIGPAAAETVRQRRMRDVECRLHHRMNCGVEDCYEPIAAFDALVST